MVDGLGSPVSACRARDREPPGAGRLGAALALRLEDGGADLAAGPILLRPAASPPAAIAAGPRTGVSRAGGDEHPWRFWIAGDPTVSPYRRHQALRIPMAR